MSGLVSGESSTIGIVSELSSASTRRHARPKREDSHTSPEGHLRCVHNAFMHWLGTQPGNRSMVDR